MTMPISGEVSHRKLGFARINMHVKSEVSILSYSKDILGGETKLKLVTWLDHAPSGTVCRLWAGTWYDQLAYQIWSL